MGYIQGKCKQSGRGSIIIEISGDKGDIYFNYFTGEIRYRNLQHPEWIGEYFSPLKPYADWPGVRETISSFLDSVISGEPNQGNAEAVAQLNLIGLASDKSIDTKGWAEVERVASVIGKDGIRK